MVDQLRDFLSALFEPDDIIELRKIHPSKKPGKGPWGTITKLLEAETLEDLKRANRAGYGIYFGVNPRKEKGKSGDTNVKLCRCLFVDFDAQDYANIPFEDLCASIKVKIKEANLPAPTAIVNSGHGYHCYWRLVEPLTLDEWKDYQLRLIQTLHSDPTCKNLERIFRLPGFANTKEKDKWVACSIVELNKVHNIADIELEPYTEEQVSSIDASKIKGIGRPTWIEEELIRSSLMRGKVNYNGEVNVASPDPSYVALSIPTSNRTFMNVFTGKWIDRSHESHAELKGNGCGEGWALKYFTLVYKGSYSKEHKEAVKLELLERYKAKFQKYLQWVAEMLRAQHSWKDGDTSAADNEKYIASLREKIARKERTNLRLNLQNPTKTAYYLQRIFYPGRLIFRHDYEIYGTIDESGAIRNYYHYITDRRGITENIYTLFRYSVQIVAIKQGGIKVEVEAPINNVQPNDVKKVIERLESMVGIYYSPDRYTVPFCRDNRIITPSLTIPYRDYDVNWQTEEETPASPLTVYHARLPYNRNKAAKMSEKMWMYLKSVFDDETIKLIRNVIKYLLTLNYSQQFMFYILGKKGRGKGVLFHIIVELIGKSNFIELSPHTLEKDDGLAEAEGKFLGGRADVRWGKFHNPQFLSEQLLAIINHEPVKIKKLYKNRYTGIIDLRLLYAGEHLPSGLDIDTHLSDKIIAIVIKDDAPNWRELPPTLDGKPIIGVNRYDNLKEELTTPEELAGVCEWAFGGDSISILHNVELGMKKINQMSAILDKVYSFVETCIDFDEKYKKDVMIKDPKFYKYQVNRDEIFITFKEFCEKKDLIYRKGENKFFQEFENHIGVRAKYQQLKHSETHRPRKWVGLKIKDGWQSEM